MEAAVCALSAEQLVVMATVLPALTVRRPGRHYKGGVSGGPDPDNAAQTPITYTALQGWHTGGFWARPQFPPSLIQRLEVVPGRPPF